MHAYSHFLSTKIEPDRPEMSGKIKKGQNVCLKLSQIYLPIPIKIWNNGKVCDHFKDCEIVKCFFTRFTCI